MLIMKMIKCNNTQNSSSSLVIDTKLYKFGICNHNQTNIINLKK